MALDTAAGYVGNCFSCFTEGEPDGCPICGRASLADEDCEHDWRRVGFSPMWGGEYECSLCLALTP